MTRPGVMVVGLPLDHLTLHHALHRLPLKVRQPRGVAETLGEGIAVNLQFCDLRNDMLSMINAIYEDMKTDGDTSCKFIKPYSLHIMVLY